MNKKTIGVLGCSNIATKSVIPAILECDEFSLYGVGSRRLGSDNYCANQFNTKAFSYDELINSDVDAIYVSLPVGLHYEWGKKVLESGKHLLLEKLFTEKHSQAVELFAIAEKNNLVCREALMYEFHPVQDQIDEIISNSGNIKVIDAHLGCPHFHDDTDIRYSKELAGGAITDYLVYPLSFVFRQLGSTYKFFRPIVKYKDGTGVDERGYIQMQYEDAVVNISYGFGHAYRNEVSVWTDKKIIKASRIFSRTSICNNPIEVWSNGECTIHETVKSNHFVRMLYSFVNEIDIGWSPSLKIDTLDRLRFIENLRTVVNVSNKREF
jgi:dTDP-3,4-didehydro-2,6-dideoxy-alpha-D-glucose 3-reductase